MGLKGHAVNNGVPSAGRGKKAQHSHAFVRRAFDAAKHVAGAAKDIGEVLRRGMSNPVIREAILHPEVAAVGTAAALVGAALTGCGVSPTQVKAAGDASKFIGTAASAARAGITKPKSSEGQAKSNDSGKLLNIDDEESALPAFSSKLDNKTNDQTKPDLKSLADLIKAKTNVSGKAMDGKSLSDTAPKSSAVSSGSSSKSEGTSVVQSKSGNQSFDFSMADMKSLGDLAKTKVSGKVQDTKEPPKSFVEFQPNAFEEVKSQKTVASAEVKRPKMQPAAAEQNDSIEAAKREAQDAKLEAQAAKRDAQEARREAQEAKDAARTAKDEAAKAKEEARKAKAEVKLPPKSGEKKAVIGPKTNKSKKPINSSNAPKLIQVSKKQVLKKPVIKLALK